ncbi:MAG: hypothetical protein PUB60_08005 [Veillonellaceae bacterium]|nr:hypothetical protein [Veillonellaceae bacterium]
MTSVLQNRVIMHVGRFSKSYKRQHILIEVFHLLQKDFPDWKIEFWGEQATNEIIQDGRNGILCEDGVEPFSEALRTLMENEMLRKKFGENAKTFVSAYAPEKVWQAWEDLLQRVFQEN